MRARNPFFLLLGVCVTGGILGALTSSVALWFADIYGLTDLAGVALHSDLTWAWLRPRLLWGAIWGAGFVFFAWAGPGKLYILALLYSLIPSAVQLFYVFPVVLGRGTMGTSLGNFAPAFVIGANAVYALVIALWVRVSVATR
jgi:hypothetical protein